MAISSSGPPVFGTLDEIRQYLVRRDYQLCYVNIPGVNNVAKEFQSPVKIQLDVNGRPRALLYQGTGLALYDDTDPPAAGKWHLRRDQKTVVMATAPTAGQPFLFLEVWGVP